MARNRRVVTWLLAKTNRSHRVDPDLPLRYIIGQIMRTAGGLTRGLVLHRSMAVIGPRTKVRGGGRVRLGRFAVIGRGCTIDGYGRDGVTIGDTCRIGDYSRITSTSHMSLMGRGFAMGEGSALGDYAHVGCSGGVTLGTNVICGPYVSFHSQNHDFDDLTEDIKQQGTTEAPIVLHDNVWVGTKATFLAGANVGEGCVVAAGAVVRGTFPANSVIAGVPAKIVSTRGT